MGTKWLLAVGLLIGIARAGCGASAEPIKNSACLECHSDKTLFKTNAAGIGIPLFLDESKFLGSVHKTNSCITCHSELTSKHPDDNVSAKPVNCGSCHESQAKE